MKKTARHIFISLAASLSLIPIRGLASSGVYPDVRVIESTENSITLEFTPRYTPGQKIFSDGKAYQTIEFEKSSGWDHADAGKPDIRFRTIAIGVRGKTNNRATIISSDFETVAGISLAPVPTLAPSKNNPSGKLYKLSSAAFATFSSPALAVLDNVARVKGTFVGYLRIFPYSIMARQKR